MKNQQISKHSGAGIASFILALISIIGMAVALFAAKSLAVPPDEGAGQAVGGFIAVAVSMFVFTVTALIGAVLGVAGTTRRDRLKLFPVLGLALNTLLVAVFVIALFAGALLGPALPGTFEGM